MTATPPARTALPGRLVELRPMEPGDLPGLANALRRPEVFAGGYGGGAAGLPAGDEAFIDWAAAYYAVGEHGIAWTVRLAAGPDAGTIVGATKLGDVELAREHVHLGWTAYDPRVWGSGVNVETKLLLIGHAFAHGFGKLRLQADARNTRSRGAIERLGATPEGVLRRDQRRADGTWRDSAVYSILAEEWPAVRAGLETRLAGLPAPVVLAERWSPSVDR
ncbi:GNAT family N-acetyltransferase [Agromyces seonyuensis]|uniref:GNAT family N-acetyltransferase n=1 Tax=Agromyces seonyuensis TaxID=2662446 RepID=A0A6I4P7H3_9MICO|nr:GNAT family protein [Agromyces seonyuensis]MWB99774.1 GNAT family N-acetyltransferase [Agromyces seonyuensis]